jgi:glycosyltransferase involved in cell wall biosynthesis
VHVGIDARLSFFRKGGISRYAINLITALARLDAADAFSILHAAGDPETHVAPDAPAMRRVDALTPCHHPRERLLLAAEIRPLNLDVFHSPDLIPPASGARRRVVSVHDLGFLDHPDHLTAAAYRHYAGQIEWAVASADAVVASSDHTRRDLIQRLHVPPARVVTIPLAAAPAFGPARDQPAIDRALARLALSRGFILFVGTIEPRKNLGMLVRAHEILRQHGDPTPPLVIVGDIGWRCADVLDAMRRHPDAILHLRNVPDDDLACLYASAGALALPSIHEGFGLTLVEAMRCGCPVVASTGGALPETAGGAALLVDAADAAGWASALAAVLKDSTLREDLRRRGRARANDFSWRATAQATLALYRDVAAA